MSRRLWFAYAAFLAVWAIMGFAEIGKYYLNDTLFARYLDGRLHINDFVNVYSAGRLARASLTRPVAVYDITVQSRSVNELVYPAKPELPFFFQYPPYTFALFLPLAWLPMPLAWLVFVVGGATLTVAALYVVARMCLPPGFPRVFAVLGGLCCFPAWIGVQLGQPTLWLMPGFAAYWLLLSRGRPFWAGVATAVMMIKIQYLPAALLVGTLVGRAKYLAGAAASFVLLMLSAMLTVGWQNVKAYPAALLSGETGHTISGVEQHMMQNARGWFFLLLSGAEHQPVKHLSIAVFLLALVLIGWLWWRFCRAGQPPVPFLVLASITTLVMLVTSLHTHWQDYLLASLPCIWLYAWLFPGRAADGTNTGRAKAGAAVRWLAVAFPVVSWLFFLLGPFLQAVFIQPYFLWAILLAAITACAARPGAGPATQPEQNQSAPEPG